MRRIIAGEIFTLTAIVVNSVGNKVDVPNLQIRITYKGITDVYTPVRIALGEYRYDYISVPNMEEGIVTALWTGLGGNHVRYANETIIYVYHSCDAPIFTIGEVRDEPVNSMLTTEETLTFGSQIHEIRIDDKVNTVNLEDELHYSANIPFVVLVPFPNFNPVGQ